MTYFFPSSVIRKVAEEAQSALPDAPVVPWEPPRPRRRWLVRTAGTRTSAADSRVENRVAPVCEAEGRDRSPKVAGAARAC
jgi:hypothetical protein